MKLKHTLPLLSLLAAALPARAVEQTLVDWNHVWKYFHTMSDDPTLDDAAIPNAGGGTLPSVGPDLIHTGFNAGAASWFAKESDFTAPTGYATVFGKGFGIDGTLVGDPVNNYSSYDGGSGPGPFGYDAIVYFGRTDIAPEMTAFGTPLTKTPATRRFASYYRTTFTAAQDYTKPRIRMLLDDNVVIFLDGVEVARVNRDNSAIAYNDVAATDTAATNNEEGLTGTAVAPAPNNGNENTIQSFFLDQAGGPGRATLTPGTKADSFVTVAVPKITAGQHTIAIIARNSGNDSSDLCMAFQLKGDDAGLSAAVSNITRNDGGTPSDVSNDTYSFDVVVTTINMPGATGWTSNATLPNPVLGLYTQTYTFTYPAQANNGAPVNTNTVTFADNINNTVTTSVTVTAPEAPNGAPLILAPATPVFSTGFEEPAVGTLNFNRKTFHTELGFASNTGSGAPAPAVAALPGGVYQDAAAAVPETNKSWRAVGGASTLTTEAIGLHPSVKGVKVTMKARAFTTSGTVFETIDAVSLGVQTSPDGTTWTLQGNVLPVLNGSPDSTAQQNLDRIITLLGDDASSLNTGTYVSLTRETIPVGSGAAFVRLVYTNAADLSGSENILLDDLQIEIASIDPNADPDLDGATNSQEEEWGSGMNDSGSYPGIQVHNIRPGVNPGEIIHRIEFITGNAFHSYTVQASDDLTAWTDTPYAGIDDVQVNEDTSLSSHRFFRIRNNY